jgi:hypothetical protein
MLSVLIIMARTNYQSGAPTQALNVSTALNVSITLAAAKGNRWSTTNSSR